jgi:hypothetical protein
MFCLSVRLFAYFSSAPTGRISVEFYNGEFYEYMSGDLNLVKVGQEYRALYGCFVFAGYINVFIKLCCAAVSVL